MYKNKIEICLEKSKQLIRWIKRKVILIIVAFMIGFSNSLNNEDNVIYGKQNYIEQENEKD